MFSIGLEPIDRDKLAELLAHSAAGAYVSFEGWVRDHNAGKAVASLEYQIYEELALKEGVKILLEAKEKFEIIDAHCFHRYGHLGLNDLAIWIGVTASHRQAAYLASKFIIDEIKHRLPVWKKEHYVNGEAKWVFCKDHHHHVSFTESDYYQRQEPIIDHHLLKSKHVLVVGAGGLGCPALVNLVSAGVGKITIIDHDHVSISNLHRQFLYNSDHVGKPKVAAAASFLKKLNPFVKINTHNIKIEDLDFQIILKTGSVDLILDCTDNMTTKFYLHDLSFSLKIPLITAAIYKMQGQVRSFLMKEPTGCWRCDREDQPFDFYTRSCNEVGVVGVVTNYVGSIQASEALNFLLQGENNTSTHTMLLDLKSLSQMKIKNKLNSDCNFCTQDNTHIPKHDLQLSKAELTKEMILLEVNEVEMSELVERLKNKEQIVLTCQQGIKSKSLAIHFRAQGLDTVYYLNNSL